MPSPIPTISAGAGGSSGGQDAGEENSGSGGENGAVGRGLGLDAVLLLVGVVGWVAVVM